MSKRASSSDPVELPKKQKMSNGAANGGPTDMEIDENLHSRQLAVYGREVMRRMAASSVLISGANGVGVEIGTACMDVMPIAFKATCSILPFLRSEECYSGWRACCDHTRSEVRRSLRSFCTVLLDRG
jgi:hypothetical protein